MGVFQSIRGSLKWGFFKMGVSMNQVEDFTLFQLEGILIVLQIELRMGLYETEEIVNCEMGV